VPATAVIHDDADTFVMVAGSDKKAHKRKITTGLTTQTLVEITGGVTAGEAVIVQGLQGLPDGAAINVAQ
jgi:membrane fusion protein (multidrug efflux system)